MTERSEKSILNAALVAVTSRPGVMAWRNNTGMAWQGDKLQVRVGQTITIRPGMTVLTDARPIIFGLPGSGDILGVNNGRGFALEGKTRTGQQRETQRKFEAAFTRAGGFYGLFRSEDEVLDLLGKM